MKKIKSLFCMLILSACLVGNAFAGDFSGGGIFSYFSNFINVVVAFAAGTGDCEGRICTNCKPQAQGGSGDCRPTE